MTPVKTAQSQALIALSLEGISRWPIPMQNHSGRGSFEQIKIISFILRGKKNPPAKEDEIAQLLPDFLFQPPSNKALSHNTILGTLLCRSRHWDHGSGEPPDDLPDLSGTGPGWPWGPRNLAFRVVNKKKKKGKVVKFFRTIQKAEWVGDNAHREFEIEKRKEK
jgi:hypothetical protein